MKQTLRSIPIMLLGTSWNIKKSKKMCHMQINRRKYPIFLSLKNWLLLTLDKHDKIKLFSVNLSQACLFIINSLREKQLFPTSLDFRKTGDNRVSIEFIRVIAYLNISFLSAIKIYFPNTTMRKLFQTAFA